MIVPTETSCKKKEKKRERKEIQNQARSAGTIAIVGPCQLANSDYGMVMSAMVLQSLSSYISSHTHTGCPEISTSIRLNPSSRLCTTRRVTGPKCRHRWTLPEPGCRPSHPLSASLFFLFLYLLKPPRPCLGLAWPDLTTGGGVFQPCDCQDAMSRGEEEEWKCTTMAAELRRFSIHRIRRVGRCLNCAVAGYWHCR